MELSGLVVPLWWNISSDRQLICTIICVCVYIYFCLLVWNQPVEEIFTLAGLTSSQVRQFEGQDVALELTLELGSGLEKAWSRGWALSGIDQRPGRGVGWGVWLKECRGHKPDPSQTAWAVGDQSRVPKRNI